VLDVTNSMVAVAAEHKSVMEVCTRVFDGLKTNLNVPEGITQLTVEAVRARVGVNPHITEQPITQVDARAVAMRLQVKW
jgi:hypothetical protein